MSTAVATPSSNVISSSRTSLLEVRGLSTAPGKAARSETPLCWR